MNQERDLPEETVVPRTADAPRAPTPDAIRYEPNALIAGKYQLSSLLGQGGMGSVWLAKNRTLDVEVALKVMRSELAEQIDGVAERMLQEARAAASVGHPAIVKVFDFGFTELGDPFIVMEVLRGESLLAAMRRRGRLLPARAAQTLLPILDALQATHARGIVHRDLKPENIFLARSGGQRLEPKVLDFGIAKLEQRAQERLTRGGAVIGSPAYMAPEQLRGEDDVDARADIWSISVVLYEMITGRRPFEGESYHGSMWNVLNAPPRPIAEHGIEDAEMWRILARGLAKRREDRYPDAQSLGRDLARWLIAQGVREDVCKASLEAWDRAPAEALVVHSFFPSNAPNAKSLLSEPADPRALGIPEVFGVPPRGFPSAAPRAALVAGGAAQLVQAAPQRFGSAQGRLVLPAIVILSALSFVLAAFWFGQRQDVAPAYIRGLSALVGSGDGDDGDSAADAPDGEGEDEGAVDGPGVLRELPKSTLKFAPLPKSGPNAPLIYVDDAQRSR